MIDIPSMIIGTTLNNKGGGGGGTVTLQNSGWVVYYDNLVDLEGNLVTCKSGSGGHTLRIGPNASVRNTASFLPGDVVIIAIKVLARSNRAVVGMSNSSNWTGESATGFMTVNKGTAYAASTGNDVLTFTFTSSSGSSGYVSLYPAGNDGGTQSQSYATFEVTGLSFNGILIFGSVTPPSA